MSDELYRVIGTTNDVTECGQCGRQELKGTVVLDVLDTDGNMSGEVAYFGTSCAARATGASARDVRDATKAAERAYPLGSRARMQLSAWAARYVGPDALTYPGRYGYPCTAAIVVAYEACRAAV